METSQNSLHNNIYSKKFIFVIVVFLMFLFCFCIFLFGLVRIYDGRLWIKKSIGFSLSDRIFETDSPETAILLAQKDFVFNMTPEITVRFYHGEVSKNVSEVEVTPLPEVQGSIEIKGNFYRTLTRSYYDVIPEFSREEFYEKLQSEVEKLLPEGKSVVIGKGLKKVLSECDTVSQSKTATPEDRLWGSRCSHLFGSLDQ